MTHLLKLALAAALLTTAPGCSTLIDVAFDAALSDRKRKRAKRYERCDPPRRRGRKVVYLVDCRCHGPCDHRG